MGLAHLVRQALALTPGAAAARAWRHGRRLLGARLAQVRETRRRTYAPWGEAGSLDSHVPAIPVELLAPCREAIREAAAHYLDHRFDVLGSGWLRVTPGMTCPGFEEVRYAPVEPPADPLDRLSPGNRSRAGAIRALIGDGYAPIDWQLDVKSGYRWREDRWHAAVPYGHARGVDIKVPWELGRLQHLPQLALAFILAGGEGTLAEGFEDPEAYRAAFRDQTLDFLAANPPGFGVNWACAMDVAIRAANLALAFDLFRRHGAELDEPFERELACALLAHGRHIAANLEWHGGRRGNHYLANVVGLLFVAAYLPRSAETDLWLAFAAEQLLAEIGHQIDEEGAGFEASTSYHRLSGEMAVFGTALLLGLDADRRQAFAAYDARRWRGRPRPSPAPLDPAVRPALARRLMRLAEFSLHVGKPSGRAVQVGDNDSGRFVKPVPVFEAGMQEASLDHRSLAAAVAGLFDRSDLADFAGSDRTAETALVAGLAGGRRLDGGPPMTAVGRGVDGEAAADGPCETVIRLPEPTVLTDVEAVAYPAFGLYIWRGRRFFLSLRCGPAARDGLGAHAHNDQLALELEVDGVTWLADPGSYVYTPAPDWRDAYRSVRAHAVPRRDGGEPAPLDRGLFRLEDRARARCLQFDATTFRGLHHGLGEPVRRTVTLDREAGLIRVCDDGPPGRTEVSEPAALRRHFGVDHLAFSPGYGRLET